MKKNIIYHVTPLPGWRDNLKLLTPHLHKFDGVKIACLTWDVTVPETAEALRVLDSMFDVVKTVNNDAQLRETATLKPLLEELYILCELDSMTFYGHTKGVTHNVNGRTRNPRLNAVKLWTELCYEHNLKDVGLVEAVLQHYPCAGTFKRYGKFKNFPEGSTWHYSGTFYWFRTADLFHGDWRGAIKAERYGAEAFPSLIWPEHKAACLFADNSPDPYNLLNLRKLIADHNKKKAEELKAVTSNATIKRISDLERRIGGLETVVDELKALLRGT